MPGSPVKIGPFTGGLNTRSEPTTVADGECIELTNFDVDIDGSITTRPPVKALALGTSTGAYYIGSFVTTAGVVYFIYQQGTNVRAYNIGSDVWTLISATALFTCTVQYQNKLWLIADTSSTATGGTWDPVAGYTAVAAIPRGVSACVYKERLFIATGKGAANPSRINFSNAANFSTWTGTDFFDVANGDGQDIIRIYSFNGYIAVFKRNSTYTFGYDSQPTKGITQIASAIIGISSPWALAEFENTLFVLYGNAVYGISNWNWDQLNVKVPFEYYSFSVKTTYSDYSLSIVNDRLIVRFYDNFYVYGLKTRAFSLWRFNASAYTPGMFVRYPALDPLTGKTFFVAGNYNTVGDKIYRLTDEYTNTDAESFLSIVNTKVYDFGVPYTFKRLFWWGVDQLSKTQVDYRVNPTVYSIPIKHSQLLGLKHSVIKTHSRPIDVDINVSDSINTSNPSGTRTFVKLIRSLRFRQISFRITTTVDGTTTTGPFKIFSLTALVTNKELVPKKIS